VRERDVGHLGGGVTQWVGKNGRVAPAGKESFRRGGGRGLTRGVRGGGVGGKDRGSKAWLYAENKEEKKKKKQAEFGPCAGGKKKKTGAEFRKRESLKPGYGNIIKQGGRLERTPRPLRGVGRAGINRKKPQEPTTVKFQL